MKVRPAPGTAVRQLGRGEETGLQTRVTLQGLPEALDLNQVEPAPRSRAPARVHPTPP
jgi:hypothetical protein